MGNIPISRQRKGERGGAIIGFFRAHRTLTTVLICIIYLATAVFATYPLVTQIDQKVPFDLGDPLFISWLVSWNDSFFLHPQFSLTKLFNTNIYYPYQNTLAYSDLMLVPSMLVLPVFYATHNPIVTVNVLLILLLAATGLAMFFLARHLTGNSIAAFIVGLLYAYSTFHIAQIGHIQLHTDLFLILMLLFLHKWLDSRKLRDLAMAAFMIWLEFLSSMYYTIYAGILLVLFIGFFYVWRELRLDRRNLVSLAVVAGFLGLAILPFARPYLDLHKSMPNFERSLSEAAVYAAGPTDYVAAVPENLLWGRWLSLGKPGVEDVLFPGLAVLVLAAVGTAGMIRNIRLKVRAAQVKLFYLITAWVAFVLSLGPYKVIHGRYLPLPFLFLFELFPGFKSMRVPARFGMLVLLGLCVPAAYGLDRLIKLWREERKKNNRADIFAVACLALIVLQGISWPIPLSQPIASGKNIPPIYRWLADYKYAEAIIELPPLESEQTKYVYYSAYHGKRLVNGYSGYTPPIWVDMETKMATFPDSGPVGYLGQLGVNGVLVHGAMIPDFKKKLKSKDMGRLKLVKRFGDDYFFMISGAKPATRL